MARAHRRGTAAWRSRTVASPPSARLTAPPPSAWSLLYPELAAAMPIPHVGRFSLAYAVPRGEPDMLNMIDTFIDSQRAAGRRYAGFRRPAGGSLGGLAGRLGPQTLL